MIELILQYFNARLSLFPGWFNVNHGLATKITRDGKTFPAVYCGDGEHTSVIDFDVDNGSTYWRKTSDVTIEPVDEQSLIAGKRLVHVTIPLRLVVMVPRAKFETDGPYRSEQVALTLVKSMVTKAYDLKTALKARKLDMRLRSFRDDTRAIMVDEFGMEQTMRFEWCMLAIDMEVHVHTMEDCLFSDCYAPTVCETALALIPPATRNECFLPAFDFGDPATQSALSEEQIADLRAWLCGALRIFNSDGSFDQTIVTDTQLPDIAVSILGALAAFPSVKPLSVTKNIIELTAVGPGVYSKPSNLLWVEAIGIGGGAGGGGGRYNIDTTNRGGGAGGTNGTLARAVIAASSLSANENYTIGAGGPGGAAINVINTTPNAGAPGGNTTFGVFLLALGGLGGAAGNASTTNSIGGAAIQTSSLIPPNPFLSCGVAAAGGGGVAAPSVGVIATHTITRGGGGASGVSSTAVPSTVVGAGGGQMRNNAGVLVQFAAGGLQGVPPPANGGSNVCTNIGLNGEIFNIGLGGAGSGGCGVITFVSYNGDGGNGGLYGGGGGGGAGTSSTGGCPRGGKGGDGAQGCLIIVEYLLS